MDTHLCILDIYIAKIIIFNRKSKLRPMMADIILLYTCSDIHSNKKACMEDRSFVERNQR